MHVVREYQPPPPPPDHPTPPLQYCAKEGIPFAPYGTLGGNSARNGKLDLVRDFPLVQAMAEKKGVSAHALVLAAMRHKWWVG